MNNLNFDVVVGFNYGDEGKGLVVNALCNKYDSESSIIVRFNGGCQAGHTVVYNKTRHVFHAYGAGTLRNFPTYLSQHFIVNPCLINKERDELSSKMGIDSVKLYIDGRCKVTTLVDVFINQIIAKFFDQHNTCGIGINETVTRYERFVQPLTYSFYHSIITKLHSTRKYIINSILNDIVDYAIERCNTINKHILGDDNGNLEKLKSLATEEAALLMIEDLENLFANSVLIESEDSLPTNIKNFIFEGAQGMLLDPEVAGCKFATRSNTTPKNAISIIKHIYNSRRSEKFLKSNLSLYYVTRSYMTRHGDGPLMHDSFFTHNTSVDQTNVFNEYQGRIRSAPIDIDDINRRFYFAKKEVMTNIVESSIIHDSINSNLVVTHCQYDYCSVIMDRGFHKIGRTEFLNAIGASYISCAEDDTELSSWPY